MTLKVLACALACDTRQGSESLVGFRTVEALATRYQTAVITSAGMTAPEGVKSVFLPIQINSPNDVASGQLLRYERLQRDRLREMLAEQKFDVVHRVTPSGFKNSLMVSPENALVVGPILGSEPYPVSFAPMFRRQLPFSYSPKALAERIRHSFARRVFSHYSTFHQLLAQSTLILVGSRTTMKRLPLQLHAKCRWIPYAGVEHDTFRPLALRHAQNVPQLLFVGRIVPYKGLELLLRAAAAARLRCRFELKIVGGGAPHYVHYCKQLAKRLKLTDTVVFQEHLPREALVNHYQSADVFCMPSVETYGLAILEAMSCGCTALVSDINGPGEIVQSGTGLKVPLDTPDQFIAEYAERIVELVENRGLRTELGAAARDHVVQHHDWRGIQTKLLEIYGEFFREQRTPGLITREPIAIP